MNGPDEAGQAVKMPLSLVVEQLARVYGIDELYMELSRQMPDNLVAVIPAAPNPDLLRRMRAAYRESGMCGAYEELVRWVREEP